VLKSCRGLQHSKTLRDDFGPFWSACSPLPLSLASYRQIWDRKLAAGQTVAQILTVSAPPGYSEHHTGRALDLTAAGCEPLTEAFEALPAFTWLAAQAEQFGFVMSYPRNNPHGVVYEPWHWCLVEG
jgi:LAS superfamily LD-carboxypeptidase LdcB